MSTHADFFSGIGGFSLGLERAGFETVCFSEVDPFACAVLATHWPHVPNLGDITKIERVPNADVWTGGFPCQDLSVAGRRAGLHGGTRSILALDFLRLADEQRPSWIILENVPGLLNSHQGEDLRTLLEILDDLGYGVAWRVLDARYFGVAQRRRRVFIVGSFGSDRARQVLFEPESSGGRAAPGVEARPRFSGSLADGADLVGSLPAAYGHHGWILGEEVHTGQIQVGDLSAHVTPSESVVSPVSDDEAMGEVLRGADVRGLHPTGAGSPAHVSPRGDGTDNLIVSGNGQAPDSAGVRTPAGVPVGHDQARGERDDPGRVVRSPAGTWPDSGYQRWTRVPHTWSGWSEVARTGGDAGHDDAIGLLGPDTPIGRDEAAGSEAPIDLDLGVRSATAWDDRRSLEQLQNGQPDRQPRPADSGREQQSGSPRRPSATPAEGGVSGDPRQLGDRRMDHADAGGTLRPEQEQSAADHSGQWLDDPGSGPVVFTGRSSTEDVSPPLRVGGRDNSHQAGNSSDNTPMVFRKATRARVVDGEESWTEADVSNTLNAFDTGTRDTHAVMSGVEDDPRLPVGYDSPRYRVLGNAVAVPVIEWIGKRLMAVMEEL